MKISLVKYSLLAVLVLLSTVLLAANKSEEKKKLIQKSFKVSERTAFSVINQFGKVEMSTWDRPEVKVDVEIIVTGRSDSRAESLLDKINVRINEGSSEIAFETDLSGNMNTKSDESFEINYKISLPAANGIAVENQFGDTYIGNRSGKSYVNVKHGSLKTGDFDGFFDLELAFGSGSVGRTTRSKVEVKYSDLEMGDGTEMEMEQQFSDVKLGNIKELELESKYGEIAIDEVDVLECDVQFSSFKMNRINKSLYMEANYVSDFELESLSKDFQFFKFYGKFSAVKLNLEPGINANLEAELSFARLSASYDDLDIFYQDKGDTRSEYKARIGKGDSDKMIIIKSSYGDLKIR